MGNDSVIDENLYLWKCHPEKICINCIHFRVNEEAGDYSEDTPGDDFGMYCYKDKWYLTGRSTEEEYRNSILMARKCGELELRKPSLPGES